jgi:hypothetical protein
MGTGMEGADVSGLEKAGQRCLQGAEIAAQVRQVMEGIVAALSAMSFFAGPWVAPIIAFLTTTVIPWLRDVETALRNFGNVLNGRAAAQRQLSQGLPINLAQLPTYTPLGTAPLPSGGGAGGPRSGSGGSGLPLPSGGGGSDPLRPTPFPSVGGPSRLTGGGGGSGGGYDAPASLGGLDGLDGVDGLGQAPAGPDLTATTAGRPGAAPSLPRPTGRTGPSAGLVAGIAAGGLVVGGGAYAAAARRRRGDTDGSELLGSTTVDRVGAPHPDTVTAADLAGPRPETSRAPDLDAEQPGSQNGSST